MINWALGIGALLVWLAATLLYLRPSIMRWVARVRHERAIAAEVAARQRKARE